jgi:hypothetical protein
MPVRPQEADEKTRRRGRAWLLVLAGVVLLVLAGGVVSLPLWNFRCSGDGWYVRAFVDSESEWLPGLNDSPTRLVTSKGETAGRAWVLRLGAWHWGLARED